MVFKSLLLLSTKYSSNEVVASKESVRQSVSQAVSQSVSQKTQGRCLSFCSKSVSQSVSKLRVDVKASVRSLKSLQRIPLQCQKIFLHIRLFQNILSILFYFEKKKNFSGVGGGYPPPLADASAKNASFFITCSLRLKEGIMHLAYCFLS